MKTIGTIFLNPRSGAAQDARTAEIRAECERSGIDVVEIRPGVDIKAAVQRGIASGQRIFIAAGGDGTIHHVSQAVALTEAKLAILPIGTVNHLAKDLGIPLDWREALQLALNGSQREIDVGSVNGTYFTNIMMLGMFPDLVRQREKLRHWYGKGRAYSTALIGSLRRLRKSTLLFETEHRAEVVQTPVFAIAVNRYDFEAPGVVAPKITFTGGQLAVYWSEAADRWTLLKMMVRFLGGRIQIGRDIKTLNTRELRVQSPHPRMRVVLNGELLTLDTPLHIRIHPRGLTIVVPHGMEEATPA